MDIMSEMKECLEIINLFKDNSDGLNKISDNDIEETANRLRVQFPKPFVEFYKIFGNNTEVLKSFFEFERLEDIKIKNDAVIFCYAHQAQKTFGILIKDLNRENPPVKFVNAGDTEWCSACMISTSFFVNIACWQVVNSMPSVASINIAEDKLKCKIQEYLFPISNEKSIALGFNFYSFYNKEKKLLASYARDLGELYVASEDDSFLNKFESESGLELDWL
jgi:hypothetical protein